MFKSGKKKKGAAAAPAVEVALGEPAAGAAPHLDVDAPAADT